MTAAEIAACQAALDAAEQAAEALRAVLHGERPHVAPTDALRLKQAQAETGWSEKTARRWAKKLGFKVGGVWYIERAKLRTVAP
ncbi:hypothetical protein [Chenggangzhangella methanolivorans]|uniref:Uncharacterized protein n=1 Tax=Chenggangzhangella methanolivorans TaxID=1437009 RepID=A0A9E6R654_9HYPH|nr:hypothetical protein [Chenggangzhangella methanolivorans]QZN98539.1 hypothetical protein K6K41_16005 [Chenggangzhangella methanolivorans]